jgi:hypothetical protein
VELSEDQTEIASQNLDTEAVLDDPTIVTAYVLGAIGRQQSITELLDGGILEVGTFKIDYIQAILSSQIFADYRGEDLGRFVTTRQDQNATRRRFDEGQASPLGFARQYGEGGDVVELWHPNRVRVPGAKLPMIEFAEEECDVDAVSHRCGEARDELRKLANQSFQIGIVARRDRAADQECELLLGVIDKGLQEA